MLYCCGDIEINPGTKNWSLTFCHWNLNGIAAYGFISLLQGYTTERNFDIMCLSETFLNSSFEIEDDRLKIECYDLIRSDHSRSCKKGGVCVYYKEHIPLVRWDGLCTLSNCLVSEIHLENEKCSLTCLYRLPSQTLHKFEIFWRDLNTLMDLLTMNFYLLSYYWRS